MKLNDFIEKLKRAVNCKTLYVSGCFGAPMNSKNKQRYTNNNDYNRNPSRKQMINEASDDTFGFDCVCLIKGILWGWTGDTSKTYGGASYCSNGVPDVGARTMCQRYLQNVSTDFSKIEVGEAVWLDGYPDSHIGVYIGNGQVIECSPAFDNCVQITYLRNIGYTDGNSRKWTKHGFIPWVDYTNYAVKSNEETCWDFLMREIGNPFGVAGLMGNIKCESGFVPNNLQNKYNEIFKMTDEEFTQAVDSNNFDFCAKGTWGYGICQWTYYSRKTALYEYAKSKGTSIGNLTMQLEYLIGELKGYKLLEQLKNAKTVREASNLIVTKFEKPKNYSTEEVQSRRAKIGEEIYGKYVLRETKVDKEPETVVGQRTYTVQKGDTLSKIASKYNTTVEKIVADNKATHSRISPNFIVTGWKILV